MVAKSHLLQANDSPYENEQCDAHRAGINCWENTSDSSMLSQLYFDSSILHMMSAVSSNDAANCYNAVNHAAGSFARQAMRVPIQIIKCYLLSIQTMRFFLKTGLGSPPCQAPCLAKKRTVLALPRPSHLWPPGTPCCFAQ